MADNNLKEIDKQVSEVETNEINEIEKIDQALDRSKEFIVDNSKMITVGILAFIVLICGVIYYIKGYKEPRNLEAAEMIFPAEQAFQMDSFNVALNGNGQVVGFLSIINEYGSTDAGNMAKAYAGICYKKLGENEKAISYLNDYSKDSKSTLAPAIEGAIGDCYWDLQQEDKAISAYKKAISSNDKLVAPIYLNRLGLLYIKKGDKENAKVQFQTIKEKYSESMQMQDALKYLSMCE